MYAEGTGIKLTLTEAPGSMCNSWWPPDSRDSCSLRGVHLSLECSVSSWITQRPSPGVAFLSENCVLPLLIVTPYDLHQDL